MTGPRTYQMLPPGHQRITLTSQGRLCTTGPSASVGPHPNIQQSSASLLQSSIQPSSPPCSTTCLHCSCVILLIMYPKFQ
ncbi:hypothetical protein PtB15_6B418 [Puccinia triticina]|nr:hypothetical protein PtB15_6B418 [Puccinia triticina]